MCVQCALDMYIMVHYKRAAALPIPSLLFNLCEGAYLIKKLFRANVLINTTRTSPIKKQQHFLDNYKNTVPEGTV